MITRLQRGWSQYTKSVFGDATTASVFDPYVINIGNKYRLYVSERMNDNIICADSENCLYFTQWKNCLHHGAVDSWEARGNRATVIKKDEEWLMWYTGQSEQNSAIGFAISKDGINFERVKDEPVLKPEGNYEKYAVMNPCVIWDAEENLYKMWYAAGEQYEPDVICYATSINGIEWTKYGNNPIFSKSSFKYD